MILKMCDYLLSSQIRGAMILKRCYYPLSSQLEEQSCYLGNLGGWGPTHFPPKFAHFFCTCHNFFLPFFCANNYYTTLLLIVCALR